MLLLLSVSLKHPVNFLSHSLQSPVHQTLEKKLNHTLFIRSTKKVLLTPEGELLLQHVKPAIQMLDEGESLLSGDNMLKGQLRIGASDTICRYYLIHTSKNSIRNSRMSGSKSPTVLRSAVQNCWKKDRLT